MSVGGSAETPSKRAKAESLVKAADSLYKPLSLPIRNFSPATSWGSYKVPSEDYFTGLSSTCPATDVELRRSHHNQILKPNDIASFTS